MTLADREELDRDLILDEVWTAIERCSEFIPGRWPEVGDWDLMVVTSFSARRNRCWGGRRNNRPFISLSLRRFMGLPQEMEFSEYKRIARSSGIGDFFGSWRECLRVLIAHELAHAVQRCDPKTRRSKPHGLEWQKIYRELRGMVLDLESGL